MSSLAVHAKSMVIDGKIAVVGTFNLDPRSANLNTESITILHSDSIATRLLAMMEDEMRPENAWETTLEFNPDREAPFRRRLDLIWARLVPRSVL
jgi:phosphatidylserine/phosphatidylglycerophosphate/cardiolipin synthase-like enzyme